MEKEFLKEKAAWKRKMKWGDMAEAARIAGVKRPTFQEWLLADVARGSDVEKRNLMALKQAVLSNKAKREKNLAEAIAA